jgi:hypothetical protein
MRPLASLPVVVVALLAACIDAPTESTTFSNRIVTNRIVTNRIVTNKLAAGKVAAAKVAASQISSSTFRVNLTAAGDLLSTDGGREVFSALVSCALPEGTIVTADLPIGTFEFFGDAGLAPEWTVQPLCADSQRWVSACLFSRVNSSDVAIPISLRGPNPALGADADEREAFPLQEGGFFGNYFTAKDEPIAWYACRGADKARGDAGDLANRNCAAPDSVALGFTRCGFNYAGDCGTFSVPHACEAFAVGGTFFQRCHTIPMVNKVPAPGPIFLQVITTYVMP